MKPTTLVVGEVIDQPYILVCQNGQIRWEKYCVELPHQPGKKYLFILAGQSNCQSVNKGPLISDDAPHPNIFQLSRGISNAIYDSSNFNQWISARDPLQHRLIYSDTSVGFGLKFAKTLLESGKFSENDQIFLLCCALGGTGFGIQTHNGQSFSWDPDASVDRNLYWEMVTDATMIFNKHSDMLFGGVIWHQGESDINFGWQYSQKLDYMINKLRHDIIPPDKDKNTIFICGTMLKSWRDLNPLQSSVIDKAHKEISYRVWLSDCAIFDHLNDSSDKYDYVHFSATAQRKMGVVYAHKYLEVLNKKEKMLEEWRKQNETFILKINVLY